ncbi:MAG: phage tail assembly chaperone [Paracoccaceae bacterium]
MAARTIGLSPTEFWDMTLPEFFAEIDANTANDGRMTADDFDELKEWMEAGK